MPVVPGHCLQVGVLPLSRLPEPLEGPAQQVRFSEGRACCVRGATFDNPSQFRSEGPACRVRCATFDNPSQFRGHDECAPPIPPFGGTRLSGPRNTD